MTFHERSTHEIKSSSMYYLPRTCVAFKTSCPSIEFDVCVIDEVGGGELSS